jgi:hypothetical protein
MKVIHHNRLNLAKLTAMECLRLVVLLDKGSGRRPVRPQRMKRSTLLRWCAVLNDTSVGTAQRLKAARILAPLLHARAR